MKGHKLACKRWLFSLQKATFYKLKDGLLHIGLVWVAFCPVSCSYEVCAASLHIWLYVEM